MTDLSDERLVAQCLDGHTHAFGLLVDRYQKVLFNVALRMVKDAQDAQDITQGVFVQAYEKLSTFNPAYKFYSWIYRMTVNASLNFIKRHQRFEAIEDGYVSDEKSPYERYQDVEMEDRVGEALFCLNPEERALILLKHIEGFSYDEIAFIFEIPQKTVKSRLYTARQRLKDILLQQGFVQRNEGARR